MHGKGLAGAVVLAVADHGMADRPQVDADLVRAARLELARELRHGDGLDVAGQDLVAGARLLAPLVHRHPRGEPGGAADRRVDEPSGRLDVAPHERAVPPVHVARGERRHEGRVGRARPCDEQQAGGALVEPVDDAGPRRVAHRGQLGEAGEEAVHERAGSLARAGVHDEAGRLVHHEEVLVLVDQRHGDRGIRLQREGGGRLGDLDLHDVALGHALRPRRHHDVADPHRAVFHEGGHLGAAAPRDHGHDPVDPLPCQRLGHDLAVLHGPFGSRSATSSRIPMPTHKDASATLKTGHHCRSTKSTTRPPRKPSPARRARSSRLPAAPPNTTP